jgi:hypothetical protein
LHDVIGTKHLASVCAEGLEEDRPMLRFGGGKELPSYEAAGKQHRANNDVSFYNWKFKDWSKFHRSSLF